MKPLSPERQALYYFGFALAGIGALLFISVFISGALHFGDFSDFQERSRSQFMRAVIGMILMIVGMGLNRVGALGAAGSGVVLDPSKAREDLEPWARMGGGLVKDALDETGLQMGSGPAGLPFDEKLRRLEQLKKDGLLSESEYQAKRQEILKQAF